MATFITGNTGIGSGAHLDFRVQDIDSGEWENPGGYEGLLLANGKPLTSSFQRTSGFGPRAAPVAGASTFHRGIDYGTPEGTQISFPGSKYLRTWEDPNGGGVVNEYEFIDPKTQRRKLAKMLHGSRQNLKTGTKSDPIATGTGNTGGLYPRQAKPDPIDVPQLSLSQTIESLRSVLPASTMALLDSKFKATPSSSGGETGSVASSLESSLIAPKPEDRGALGGVTVGDPSRAINESAGAKLLRMGSERGARLLSSPGITL